MQRQQGSSGRSGENFRNLQRTVHSQGDFDLKGGFGSTPTDFAFAEHNDLKSVFILLYLDTTHTKKGLNITKGFKEHSEEHLQY